MGKSIGSKPLYWFAWFDYMLYRFFAYWGEVIASRPNKFFYAVLLIAAIFHPLFGGFLAISLLCHAYKRHKEGQWENSQSMSKF